MWTTEWYYIDPLISAAIGLFILPRTWNLLKEAVGILLEGTPSDVSIAEIRKDLENMTGILGVHDLHVWALTSGVNAISVHVVVENEASHNETLSKIHQLLESQHKIKHATVQLEREGFSEHETHN